jgi:penicillin-binding protein 2
MVAVASPGGTAYRAQAGAPYQMAGKTGTAQAYSYGGGRGVHGTAGAWKLRDHAWFVAFAPYDDPRYAISVLVEHGGFGASAAAPRAREIMRTVLLKDPEIRKRIENPTPMPELPPDVQNDDDLPDPPDPVQAAAPTRQTPA